jgi:integrase
MEKKRKRKTTIMEAGIPIRVLTHRKSAPYQVDVYRSGARRRFSFATEAEARKKCLELAGSMVDEGLQALRLTKAERLDAERALKLLGSAASLEAAAVFFLKHTVAGDAGLPVRDVVKQLLAAKRGANRRPATLADAEHRLNRVVESFGDRPLGTITLHDLEMWLNGLDVGPVTRGNFRTAVIGLFNYGVKRGLIDRNPAMGLPKSGKDQSMPVILSVKQVEALLNAASLKAPEMVPYFAVGLFAGLRPKNELAGLKWSSIDFKAKTILVEPATAKKRRTRYVTLSANLAAWLAPHRQDVGTIFYSRRKFRTVVTEAGLSDWTPDVMRHSFASYHLAHHGDANATALQLGHAGAPGVLFDHYRALVQKKKDAAAFWKIRPKASKVVAFPNTATA